MNGKPRVKEIRNGILYLNCSKCGRMLVEQEFSLMHTQTGHEYRRSYCMKCNNELSRQRRLNTKDKKSQKSAMQMQEERERRRLRSEEIKRAKQLAEEIDRAPRKRTGNRANICIDCQKACGGCSWSEVDNTKKGKPIKFQPVNGWKAEKTYYIDNGLAFETYSITACPEFIPDEPRKTQDIVDGK